jgi:hypothetical protein
LYGRSTMYAAVSLPVTRILRELESCAKGL